jgi:hypothetical protein
MLCYLFVVKCYFSQFIQTTQFRKEVIEVHSHHKMGMLCNNTAYRFIKIKKSESNEHLKKRKENIRGILSGKVSL